MGLRSMVACMELSTLLANWRIRWCRWSESTSIVESQVRHPLLLRTTARPKTGPLMAASNSSVSRFFFVTAIGFSLCELSLCNENVCHNIVVIDLTMRHVGQMGSLCLVRNLYLSDKGKGMCYDEIGLCAQNMVTIVLFNG